MANLSSAENELCTKLGLRAYRRPENQRVLYVAPDPQKQVSKSVCWNFGAQMNPAPGQAGLGVGLNDGVGQHVPLDSLPVRLCTKTGPGAVIPFSLAVQYVQNKGFKVWEEASEQEREMQKTSPEHIAQRESLRIKKLNNAQKNGLGVANVDDVAGILGAAIKEAVGEGARRPGRPAKSED